MKKYIFNLFLFLFYIQIFLLNITTNVECYINGTIVGDYPSVSISSSGQYIVAVVSQNVSPYNQYCVTSSNYGISWKSTENNPPLFSYSGTAISSSGEYSYVVGSFNIYSSSDYGVTFKLTQAPSSNLWHAIACSQSGQFVVSIIQGDSFVYTSNNYGQNWNQSSLVISGTQVSMDFSGQYILINAVIGGLYLSSTYGSTWTNTMATNNYNYATLSSSPPYYIYATYNSFIGNNILVSTNFGLSFSSITLASSQFYFLSIVSSSNGQNLAAAAYVYLNSVTFEGICSSFNYGKNWTLINASLSLSPWVSLAISASGQFITAGQYNGSVRVFSQILPPTSNPTLAPTYSVNAPTPKPSKSPTLFPTRPPSVNPTFAPTPVPTWIKSDSPSVQWAEAINKGSFMAAFSLNEIWTSTNYGLNWNQKINFPSSIGLSCLASNSTGQYLIAFGGGGMATSRDYGNTWSSSTSTPLENGCSIVSASSTLQYIAVASIYYNFTSDSYALYISSNYGSTFAFIPVYAQSPFTSVLVSSNGSVIIAVSPFNLVISNDYGRHFQNYQSPGCYNTMAASSSCSFLLCGSATQMLVSTNTGLSWNPIATSFTGIWSGISISSSGEYISAVFESSQVYSIYVSFDYANSWSMTSAPTMTSGSGMWAWTSLDTSINSTGLYILSSKAGYSSIYTNTQLIPTASPTPRPSSFRPTFTPSSFRPTFTPSSFRPTLRPTFMPSVGPTRAPTSRPTGPTSTPTSSPSTPTSSPSQSPSFPGDLATGFANIFYYADSRCTQVMTQYGTITNRCLPSSDSSNSDGEPNSMYMYCDQGNVSSYSYNTLNCTGQPVQVQSMEVNKCFWDGYVGISFSCQESGKPDIVTDSLVNFVYSGHECSGDIYEYYALPLDNQMGDCGTILGNISYNCNNGIPTIIDYSDDTCTDPIHTLSGLECFSNESAISSSVISCYTVSSSSLSIDLDVVYTITGPSYSEYQNNQAAYITTLTLTIVNSTNVELEKQGSAGYITPFNILDLTVIPSTTTLSLSTGTTVALSSSSSSIQVSFTIQSSMASLSFTNVQQALTNAYSFGTFDTSLHYYAVINNAPGLQTATLSSISISNLENPKSNKKGINAGVIAGAVLGSITFISLILLAYTYLKRKKIKSANINSSVTSRETTSPIAHRISMVSETSSSMTRASTLNPIVPHEEL